MEADANSTSPIEIDRHRIRVISERFARVSSSRWQRAMELLRPKQRMFLDCIPALLHLNTPTLPGYSGSKKIHGIENWEPEDAIVKKLSALWPAFNTKPKHFTKTKKGFVRSLCVMGSIGSIAQSNDSDFDFWVIHNSVDESELIHLNQKLREIESFGKRLKLEIHFFAMTEKNIREGNLGKLDSDSSGHTQHKLLLDEFYRTHIHLAGAIPLWYLIPPDYEEHYETYAHTLLSRRFVHHSQVVDLGAVLPIPAHEYASSGMWHLFKGLKSPYKALIKIALCRAYAAQLPTIEPLSAYFKRCMYQDHLNHSMLDPYLMMLNTIEQHLQTCEREKDIDFIRICAYYKLTGNSSFINDENSWQHHFFKKLLAQWNWSERKVQELEQTRSSQQAYLTAQNEIISEQLMEGHRAIMELHMAGDTWTPELAHELDQIKAQLHAYFSVMPHKIPTLSPGIGYRMHAQVTITQIVTTWSMSALVNGILDGLYYHTSLVNVLMWGIVNKQITANTQVVFRCSHNWLALHASQLLKYLLEHARQRKSELTDNPRPKLTKSILVLNGSRQHASMHLSESATHVEEIFDPLCHGSAQESLIVETDLISLNDWGETFVESGYNPEHLVECLLSYLQYIVYESNGEYFSIQCFNGVYSQILKTRMTYLTIAMAKWFKAHKKARFLFEWGPKIVIIERYDDKWSVDWQQIHQLELVNREAFYLPFAVDPASQHLGPLKHLSAHGSSNAVTLMITEDHQDQRTLWINDERGYCRSFALSQQYWKEEINGYYQYVQNIQKHLNLQRSFQDIITEQSVFCFFYEMDNDRLQALVLSSNHFGEASIQLKRLPALSRHYQYRVVDGKTTTPQIFDHLEFSQFLKELSPQQKIYIVDMFPDLKSPFKSTMQAIIERDEWNKELVNAQQTNPLFSPLHSSKNNM